MLTTLVPCNALTSPPPPVIAPSARAGVDPLLAQYGSSREANLAIAEALQQAADADKDNSTYVTANADGVTIHYPTGPVSNTVGLERYAPYLGALNVIEFHRVIRRSYVGLGHGALNFHFDQEERRFLAEKAIPAICGAKVLQGRESGESVIRFGIKSFGIGICGEEFGLILGLLLHEMTTRTDFDGLISVDCIAFDINLGILNSSYDHIQAAAKHAVASSELKGRVEVRYGGYYGDLADERILPAMLRHGSPDLSLWRHTHVLACGTISPMQAFEIVEGMGRNTASPGAVIVKELAPSLPEGLLMIRDR